MLCSRLADDILRPVYILYIFLMTSFNQSVHNSWSAGKNPLNSEFVPSLLAKADKILSGGQARAAEQMESLRQTTLGKCVSSSDHLSLFLFWFIRRCTHHCPGRVRTASSEKRNIQIGNNFLTNISIYDNFLRHCCRETSRSCVRYADTQRCVMLCCLFRVESITYYHMIINNNLIMWLLRILHCYH